MEGIGIVKIFDESKTCTKAIITNLNTIRRRIARIHRLANLQNLRNSNGDRGNIGEALFMQSKKKKVVSTTLDF